MAKTLQVSQPAISKYLRDRTPPAETLLRLAELGQTTIEWILLGRKSYVHESGAARVAEPSPAYDADWQLAQKVAALPPAQKEALMVLIAELSVKKD